MEKEIGFIDMDQVLCDFMSAARKRFSHEPKIEFPQSEFGFFTDLKPMKGAIEAFKLIETLYDVRVLTRASPRNIASYSEKAFWVKKYLGYEAQEKMIFSGDKSIVKGIFLIDDGDNAKQKYFDGILIPFGNSEFPDWEIILKHPLFKPKK